MSNNLNSHNNISLISAILENRYNKIKIKTTKYRELILNDIEKKNTERKIFGFMSGNDIKIETFVKPYDEPINLNFKINIDLQDQDKNIVNLFKKSDLELEKVIVIINNFIKAINDNTLTIYSSYNYAIDSEKKEKIILNNKYIKEIIIMNLEIKKEFCLLWKLFEKIYLLTNQIKKNEINEDDDNQVINIIKNNAQNDIIKSKANNQINDIMEILINIKILIDIADNNKQLFSIDDIDKIVNNYIFLIKYIQLF